MPASFLTPIQDQAGRIAADTKTALAALPAPSRWFHIFYLSGPFILLIERSPADLWLSLCGLVFFARSFFVRDWSWLRFVWVQACLGFWAVCLLSAALSDVPAYALGEAFIWIRFPLFAFASCFWLARDPRLLTAMMASTVLGILVMSGILSAEVLIMDRFGERLSWPYGDLVPGNYLAKAGLPAVCVIAALAVSRQRPYNNLALLAVIFVLFASFLAAERINFIILVCGAALAGLVWRPHLLRCGVVVAASATGLIVVLITAPLLAARYVDSFIAEFPTMRTSEYYKVLHGGVDIFLQAPFFGIGTASYRPLCPSLTTGKADIDCTLHPHNYYIQLLSETGIIGFASGVVMISTIIWYCLATGVKTRHCVIAATAFVVPLGLFFPIQTTADFFGQWNNVFMWSAVALALSAKISERQENEDK